MTEESSVGHQADRGISFSLNIIGTMAQRHPMDWPDNDHIRDVEADFQQRIARIRQLVEDLSEPIEHIDDPSEDPTDIRYFCRYVTRRDGELLHFVYSVGTVDLESQHLTATYERVFTYDKDNNLVGLIEKQLLTNTATNFLEDRYAGESADEDFAVTAANVAETQLT